MNSRRSQESPAFQSTFRWEERDGHRWATWLATGLVTVAITMAIVGLPPVDLHGLLHKFGIMDPLCGGTRAARLTVLGRLGEAWQYNPLGILVVAVSSLLVFRSALGLTARRWMNMDLTLSLRGRRIAYGVLLILLTLLQIRQQMRADLLMQGTGTWI